jgi:hypothetical protein
LAQAQQEAMKRFKRIRKVTVLPGRRLALDWDDGVRSIKDMSDLIQKRAAFKPLADEQVFAKARVADQGRAVRWTRDIDYCADALWVETKANYIPLPPRMSLRKVSPKRRDTQLRDAG